MEGIPSGGRQGLVSDDAPDELAVAVSRRVTVPVVSVHPFRSIPYTGSGVSVHLEDGGRRSAGLS